MYDLISYLHFNDLGVPAVRSCKHNLHTLPVSPAFGSSYDSGYDARSSLRGRCNSSYAPNGHTQGMLAAYRSADPIVVTLKV